MRQSDAVRALAALSQETRLQAFRALVVAGPEGMTPSDLAYHLDVAASRLSFHLKELLFAQLITQERDGRNLIYRARFDRMQSLMGFLTAHCCAGEACEVTRPGKVTR
jgi:ArsR family transcriptional regulator, arsenate/arsenite/antimonite-responsive transcriptional repressor